MNGKTYIVIAGDSGVYFGWTENGVQDLGADGRIVLNNARHLRRVYTVGRQGAGAASDIAMYGVDVSSPSILEPVPGESVFLGVRRAFTASEACIKTLVK